MKKSGIAFHPYDILWEYCFDYDEGVKVIKEYKPYDEQRLRLRLFKLIPSNRLPKAGLKAYMKAGEAYHKARETYGKAGEAYDKAWEAYDKAGEAYDKAGEAYDKAGEAYGKAREAYHKAREAHRKAWGVYNKANQRALEKLHEELCPNCPWDGTTIIS